MYLPANLESGATVQAYIETNTTEPFTAELNFIHSNEDRHFYSSARIENGEGSIDIEVCPTVVGGTFFLSLIHFYELWKAALFD